MLKPWPLPSVSECDCIWRQSLKTYLNYNEAVYDTCPYNKDQGQTQEETEQRIISELRAKPSEEAKLAVTLISALLSAELRGN